MFGLARKRTPIVAQTYCRWKNPGVEQSTALAWLVYAKVDLVSLILRGRAMQGNAHEARLSGHRRRSVTRAAIVRTIARPRT
jgi:hypothetical protein